VGTGQAPRDESIDLRALAATMMGKGAATHTMWTIKTHEEIYPPPAQSQDGARILFTDRDHNVYCTDSNGVPQYKTSLSAAISETPAPCPDGSAIVRLDRELVRLDASGALKWSRSFERLHGKPFVASDGTIFIAEQCKTDDGNEHYYFTAVDPEDGATKKQIETRSSCSENAVEGMDGRIYVTDREH